VSYNYIFFSVPTQTRQKITVKAKKKAAKKKEENMKRQEKHIQKRVEAKKTEIIESTRKNSLTIQTILISDSQSELHGLASPPAQVRVMGGDSQALSPFSSPVVLFPEPGCISTPRSPCLKEVMGDLSGRVVSLVDEDDLVMAMSSANLDQNDDDDDDSNEVSSRTSMSHLRSPPPRKSCVGDANHTVTVDDQCAFSPTPSHESSPPAVVQTPLKSAVSQPVAPKSAMKRKLSGYSETTKLSAMLLSPDSLLRVRAKEAELNKRRCESPRRACLKICEFRVNS
jgi:hypothetical protein